MQKFKELFKKHTENLQEISKTNAENHRNLQESCIKSARTSNNNIENQ